MEDEALLVPISALEHWSFCRRQWGLIHLEGQWAENVRTIEGRQLHEKVDLPGLEQRPGLRIVRALALASEKHRLVGKADVVAFLEDPGYPAPGRPFPVEYKRGRKETFRHAELQLCAQALCLEDMLDVAVPEGAIYHGASRRRRSVAFDEALRRDTLGAIQAVLEAMVAQRTPPPEPGPKCESCSLRELCLPDLPRGAALSRYLGELR